MKRNIGMALVAITAIGVFVLWGNASGLFDERLAAPNPPAYVKPVPADWSVAQVQRDQKIADHIATHKVNYDHFANHAVSKTDGIPLIILKLLPEVAPEFWGDKENFLSVMGLFHDERLQGYPFPRGIGFTGLSREEPQSAIDYASFTCGGCHIGRVRLPSGQFKYLDGGVNAHFDVIGYRLRIVNSLKKIYGDETDPAKKLQLVVDAFSSALDRVQKTDPHYFYNNYQHDDKNFNAEYEAQQIALFKASAADHIYKFMTHQERVYSGWKIISDKFYPNIAERAAKGFAGMEDAIAFNAAGTYLDFKDGKWTRLLAPLVLPKSHGVTDIMVVWDQDSRNPRWNEDKSNLINGGGQWNGHIPLPIYKNIAAQITLGFDNVDVSVSEHADRLLDKLPPAIYPFEVDTRLAEKGQALFAENCASCHQPNNGKVYRQLGTDLGRAKIAGTLITVGAQLSFSSDKVCSPTTMVEVEGEMVAPCGEYRGVSMEGKSKYVMTPPRIHNGYNALPLTGLWAQAPYLHNGSVPTLYHLLIPGERPEVFMKSRLDYDTDKVGFDWSIDRVGAIGVEEGYRFDTASSPALSNQGHDKDITIEGVTHKLDWSDDKRGVMALLEYLKTL